MMLCLTRQGVVALEALVFEVHWRGYKNGKHVNELINTFDTLEEAEKSIHDWWHQNDFKPPYVIVTQHEDGFTWDYGSHTCFYDILEV